MIKLKVILYGYQGNGYSKKKKNGSGGYGQKMDITFNPKKAFKVNGANKNLVNGYYPFYVNINVGPGASGNKDINIAAGDGGGASDIRYPTNDIIHRVLVSGGGGGGSC